MAQNATPVTVLCAPAGFGKTEALAETCYEMLAKGLHAGWCDGEYAAQQRDVSSSQTDASLLQVFDEHHTLFVDDADRLDSRTVTSLVGSAIAHGKKLFVATRRLESLQLARHLASGNAQLLPPELLLWQRDVLASACVGLASGRLRVIERLAEGWAAPAMLLARYFTQGGRYDDEGGYLSDSHIAGFIAEELLPALPREWRQGLFALSVADEFDGRLVGMLAPEGGLTIEALRSHLGPLIVRTSHAPDWRFNRLLRHYLQIQLAGLGKAERNHLRGIVTNWAADRGDIVAAASIVVQQIDSEKFLDLVTASGGLTLWLTKGYDHVRRLVEIADGAGIEGDARFQLLRCAALLKHGRVLEADVLYNRAIRSLPDTAEARRDGALIRVTLLICGCRDPAPEDALAFRDLETFALEEGWKTTLPTIRAIHHSQHAEFDAALGAILEASDHGIAAGIDYNLLFLDIHRAGIFLAQGDLAAGRKALLRARVRWRRDYRHDRGAETVISTLFAQLEFEAGRWRNAALHLKKSASRLQQSEAWLDIYVASFEPMFRLAAQQYGVAAAVVAIDRIRDQLSKRGLDRVAVLLAGLRIALEGEEWLLLGGDAPAGLAEARPPEVDDGASWQEREFATLAGAYCDLAAGAPAGAIERLSHFIDYARRKNLRRSLVRALLLRAAAHDLLGSAEQAAVDFEEALAIGEEVGLRQAFAEFGGPHTSAQLANRPATGFALGLGRSGPRTAATTKQSLTRRERQMLEALRGGGSDKAIGRDLGITEHGVRFHLKNLYAKLGVHDRAAAVAMDDLPT